MPTLPDVRQSHSFDCLKAAVKCVIQFWGDKVRNCDIACSPLDGFHPLSVPAVFRGAGLKVIMGEADIELVKLLVKLGRPVLTLVQSHGGGHYIVIGDVKRGRVYFHDPFYGPDSERIHDFMARWYDVDILGTRYHQFIVCAFP